MFINSPQTHQQFVKKIQRKLKNKVFDERGTVAC